MKMREKASTLDNMELDRDARQDIMEMQRAEIMKKGDAIRSMRCFHLERLAAEEKERLARATEARDSRNRQIERTYKLAKELSRLKNLEAQELLQLRRSKTASQFLTARCHEEARAQLLEGKVRGEASATELLKKWYSDESFNEIQRVLVEEKKRSYCADIQNQMIQKRRILRELNEEKQQERKVLEEMAEVIHEDDVREETRRKEIETRLQAEKDAFFDARRTWKEILKATLCEEEKKIGEVIAEKEAWHRKQIEGKSDIRKAREATIEKIARKMLDEEMKMKEREDICTELYLEKRQDEQIKKSRRLLLEKHQRMKKLQDDIVNYQIADAERKQEERAIDADFTRYLYKEWNKLEELDKQKIQTQRKKNEEYGKDLKNIITNHTIEHAMKILERQRGDKNECKEINSDDQTKTACS